MSKRLSIAQKLQSKLLSGSASSASSKPIEEEADRPSTSAATAKQNKANTCVHAEPKNVFGKLFEHFKAVNREKQDGFKIEENVCPLTAKGECKNEKELEDLLLQQTRRILRA
ncbi:unnamed protein product [Ceratitis capitata]|uniref:(Mediterranean fruit fly) hypothetical protein n=1 Tax=Ceratitis capitata TaxID=7213 RepID=A0A811V3H0_CERCA|nr:unnamed protein product [Ceratitis capitata]